MKHFIDSFPYFNPEPKDYVYHFYIEVFNGDFVETSFSDYMSTLKTCRRYNYGHRVDVHMYMYRCFNLFLEKK